MAATTRRDSSSRGSSRASAARSNGTSSGRASQAATRGRSAGARNASTRSRKASSGNGSGAKPRSGNGGRAKAQSGNGGRAKAQGGNRASASKSSNGSSVRETLTHVAIPAATGALGVAGGLLLGRSALQQNPKILGVRVPRVSIDLTNLGKQIGDAGRQFARLAHEVETAREKAEKVGRAIS